MNYFVFLNSSLAGGDLYWDWSYPMTPDGDCDDTMQECIDGDDDAYLTRLFDYLWQGALDTVPGLAHDVAA